MTKAFPDGLAHIDIVTRQGADAIQADDAPSAGLPLHQKPQGLRKILFQDDEQQAMFTGCCGH